MSIKLFSTLLILVLNFAFAYTQDDKSVTTYPGQDIFISEIMINPQSVPDKFGEWIEIFNPTDIPVDINGWILYDLSFTFHLINNGGPLIIPPKDFIVLCRSDNPAINGGIIPDYEYSDIKLNNNSDEIILATGFGMEIDRVEYSTSNSWPDSNGESIIFIGAPGQDNNISSNWTLSAFRENSFNTQHSDKGSPGSNGIGQNLFPFTSWTGTGQWTSGNFPGNNNWSNGSPGNMTTVRINDEIEIIEDVFCDNLIIEPYGNLTIDYSGNLNIEEDLIINSDDQGLVSGSFIDLGSYSFGGISVYNRHIPDSGWHFISSPIVEGSGFITGDLMPDNGDAYMIAFNDGSDWGEYIASASMTFEVMKGYSVWLTEPKTISITGEFNSGLIDYPVIETGNKFNLVGNPYPSAIDWDAASGWSRNRISQSIWLWNQEAGNYGVFLSSPGGGLSTNNANHYIPACQGFFVQTVGSGPILKINNEARVHDDQPFFKSTNDPDNLLRVSVSGDNGKDEIIVFFTPEATTGLDENLDVEKLEGSEDSPQLYSRYFDKQFSIASFPELNNNMFLPVFFEPRKNGYYNLNIVGVSSFQNNIRIILEDNLLNTFTECLEDITYPMEADTFDLYNRFIIHFLNSSPSSTDPKGPDIFANENYIYIRSFEPLAGLVEVYNSLGQIILKSDINSAINKIDMSGKKGVFILHLVTESQNLSKRLFLK